MNEEKKTGSHYVVSFYNNIHLLNHTYSQYINLILELGFKHGDNPDSKSMTDEERQTLSTLAQTLRHYANIIFIEYKSIFKALNLDEEPEIEEDYKAIRNEFIMQRKTLDRFVINLNAVLVREVLKDLLTTSQEIYSQIYQDGTKNETTDTTTKF